MAIGPAVRRPEAWGARAGAWLRTKNGRRARAAIAEAIGERPNWRKAALLVPGGLAAAPPGGRTFGLSAARILAAEGEWAVTGAAIR